MPHLAFAHKLPAATVGRDYPVDMKMEHRITATAAGTVAALLVGVGSVVSEGDVLIELA